MTLIFGAKIFRKLPYFFWQKSIENQIVFWDKNLMNAPQFLRQKL